MGSAYGVVDATSPACGLCMSGSEIMVYGTPAIGIPVRRETALAIYIYVWMAQFTVLVPSKPELGARSGEETVTVRSTTSPDPLIR